jgi:hypothetical protein
VILQIQTQPVPNAKLVFTMMYQETKRAKTVQLVTINMNMARRTVLGACQENIKINPDQLVVKDVQVAVNLIQALHVVLLRFIA